MKRILWLLPLLLAGCFGASTIQRSYYVLHGVTAPRTDTPPIRGLLRVRNLDAVTIYEKFQMVIRRSPYELRYNENNVWAVKPDRMLSDTIAQALGRQQFSAVARELGELRPDYILSGDLNAIEIYDSDDVWFAHLAISLSLSRYSDGETLLMYSFDERKPVPRRTFSNAVRALSELLSTALDELTERMAALDLPRTQVDPDLRRAPPTSRPARPPEERPTAAEEPPGLSDPTPSETIFVPERPAEPTPE